MSFFTILTSKPTTTIRRSLCNVTKENETKDNHRNTNKEEVRYLTQEALDDMAAFANGNYGEQKDTVPPTPPLTPSKPTDADIDSMASSINSLSLQTSMEKKRTSCQCSHPQKMKRRKVKSRTGSGNHCHPAAPKQS